MNETIENLKSRRSIRKFKDEQITDEELKTILEAGTYAPTGRGAQSPKISVLWRENIADCSGKYRMANLEGRRFKRVGGSG